MPGELLKTTKPYLSIVQGRLNQKVSEDTEGAVKREYELKDGTKGVKFVKYFKNWTGRITDLRVKQTDFGQMLDVVFDDAVLSLNTESRYFTDFSKKLRGANVNQPITIAPFDFEPDGKRVVGVLMVQNGQKLRNYYWENETKRTINGFPIPQEKNMTKDDWKVFFIGVKKFLLKELELIKQEINPEVTQEMVDESFDEAIVEAQNEMEDEEIDVKNIPF